MKEVIIYRDGWPSSGEITFTPGWQKFSFRFLSSLAMAGLLFFLSPFLVLETHWQTRNLVSQPKMEAVLEKADPQFSLVIPKLDLNTTITANVSLNNKEEYRLALKNGVAHAAGSFFPGQGGTIYLFGHSIDYLWRAVDFEPSFYLLKNLEPGDQIDLFYQQDLYAYRVTTKKVVSPTDKEFLKVGLGQEKLILQTCWPPGTTWQRLVVMATPVI